LLVVESFFKLTGNNPGRDEAALCGDGWQSVRRSHGLLSPIVFRITLISI
jgi:hypothetical protein